MRLKTAIISMVGGLVGAMLLANQAMARRQIIEPADIPESGMYVEEFARLDTAMKQLLSKWQIPGASLALVKDGQLLLSRGYGYADVETLSRVQPESLFRIASLSKPVTAACVLMLVQEKKLALNDRLKGLLKDWPVLSQESKDQRIDNITVQQLLDMSAGWDKRRSGDPVLKPVINTAARRLGLSPPADFQATARFVLGRRLDFQPGESFSYCNFGYGLLGRIIEQLSGQDYDQYARCALLEPLGIRGFAKGFTSRFDLLPGEVTYYGYPGEGKVSNIFPDEEKRVSAPYGRAYLEADTAMFGWIACASDIARFVDALVSPKRSPLNEDLRQILSARPTLPVWAGKRNYFAMGFDVEEIPGSGKVLFKDGSLPGSRAFVEQRANGLTWCCLFNCRPKWRRSDPFGKEVRQSIDSCLNSHESLKPKQ